MLVGCSDLTCVSAGCSQKFSTSLEVATIEKYKKLRTSHGALAFFKPLFFGRPVN